MNKAPKKKKAKGLGRGLDALIPAAHMDQSTSSLSPIPETTPSDPSLGVLMHLNPEMIKPNPRQPRKYFNEEALEELAESVKNDGVQEPLIVRKVGDSYEIVCGERRCRAAVMAGLETVPVICRPIADQEMLKFGIIENIQREDLNAIELAQAYKELMDEYEWTQEELSREVGKKRATVTNTLRLLQLPEGIQQQVADGLLSMGHARALLSLASTTEQLALARRIISQGLSVRQAEQMVSQRSENKKRPSRQKAEKEPHIKDLEERLRRSLGTKVNVKPTDQEKGTIEIAYFSLDDLDRLLDCMIR
ncbi:MAG: ParB/RepB/Spo0J family partition protein [Candidatus Hydrogenedens sp.]|nr:ParB/RepB/Spo0J family partition protein [Candidatus Hydrogenedens sp.]